MKLHTGLVFAACVSLGLISYACVNGDTVENGVTGSGGSGSGTGGSSTGGSNGSGTGGNGSGTGGNGSSTGGNTGSGGNVSHTGGSTGTGGNGSGTGGNGSGTGGNGSGTGGSGSGTGGSVTGGNCTQGATLAPAMALITDFSDTASGTKAGVFVFGSSAGDPGSTTVFSNPASTPGTLSVTGGALSFSATLSVSTGTGSDEYPYNGFGIILNGPACVDVSAYSAVSFTISGSVGSCGLVFSFNDAEHTNASDDAMRGLATGGAYAPQLDIASMVKAAASTVTVPLSMTGFTGGSPAVSASYPDKTKFTGIQFQFTNSMTATKTCMGMITLDNIMFVK